VDDFLALLAPAVEAVRVADPADEATKMGPLISAAQRERVRSFIPDGSPVVIRGHIPEGPGFWFPPTVLAPASSDDPTLQDEIFGPVVSVVPFDDAGHAVRLANDSRYGLVGSIWTENLGRGLRVARAIEAGNLSVNSHSSVRNWTPFGGFKQSGVGRELGPEAPDGFTEVKNIFISTEGQTTQ
jgi:acyl-CoA reductase-like NAD-dependent aldehyde dehydrogenase